MIWQDKRNPFAVQLARIILQSEWNEKQLNSDLKEFGFKWGLELVDYLFFKFPTQPSPPKLYRLLAQLIDHHKNSSDFDVELYEDFLDDDDFLAQFDRRFDKSYTATDHLTWDIQTGISEEWLEEQAEAMLRRGEYKALNNVQELLNFLNLSLEELDFLSDYSLREMHKTDKAHQNYHYIFKKKRHGQRLLEVPKTLLKECQSRIQKHILSKVTAHESACAYVTGKSIKDFAEPHVNQKLILKLDLKDFFATIRPYQIQELYLELGYPYIVAKYLTGLCTNCPPSQIWHQLEDSYKTAHLPQGAPTSPALSNLIFREIDRRLHKAAQKAKINYTRYADDLAFSGDFRPEQFQWTVHKIVSKAGFTINPRKTRIQSRNQRQALCNITVNDKVNCSRKEYDELKAIIHNCQKYGFDSQNRHNHPNFQAHLLGRIQHLKSLNESRGEKLLKKYLNLQKMN